jgi:hypothetical protein
MEAFGFKVYIDVIWTPGFYTRILLKNAGYVPAIVVQTVYPVKRDFVAQGRASVFPPFSTTGARSLLSADQTAYAMFFLPAVTFSAFIVRTTRLVGLIHLRTQ